MTEPAPIVLFDGVCNLCEGVVRFVVRRDPEARFRFAALQSEVGAVLLARHGLPNQRFETLVLIEGVRCRTRSDAVLGIARRLPGAWWLLGVLYLVPRPLRDWAYGQVASRRYRWFGRKPECLVPTPELAARFLDSPSLADAPRPAAANPASSTGRSPGR